MFQWEGDIDPQSPLVMDHGVRGTPVLPGAALIEMALVLTRRWGLVGSRLRQVGFVAPLSRGRLRQTLDEGGWLAAQDGRPVMRCSVDTEAAVGGRVELSEWTDTERLAPERVYAALARSGLSYGPLYRTLAGLRLRGDEVLAELTRPAAGGEEEGFLVHPARIDGAIQALAGLLDLDDPAGPPILFAVEAVECAVSPTIPLWAWGRRCSSDGTRFDVCLLDADGAVQLSMRGLTVRRPGHARGARGSRAGGVVVEGEGARLSRVSYVADEGRTGAPLAGRWLVVGCGDVADALTTELGRRGVEAVRAPGEEVPAGWFEEAWTGVIDALHCSRGDASVATRRSSELERSLALTRAVLGARIPPRTLAIVTTDGLPVGDVRRLVPGHAAALGLARCVPLESDRVEVRRVDVGGEGSPGSLAQDAVLGLTRAEPELAVRDGRVWLPRRVTCEATPGGPALAGQAFVITGGFGALGRAVVDWLIAQGARVGVIGRRIDQATLERWQAAGEAVAVACDVADAAALAAALATLRRRLGPLRGILHLAGEKRDGLLRTKSVEALRAVWSAKVGGALALVEHAEPGELLVFFGSQAGVEGNAGQGDYAAANAFLDALALRSCAWGRPAVAIDYGPWRGFGMARALDPEVPALSREDGLAALEQALSGSGPQLVVTAASEQGAARAIRADGEPAKQGAGEVGAVVRRTVARAMGLAAVADAQALESLGIDSVLSVEVARELGRALGLELPPTLLFDHATVGALARELAKRAGDAPRREDRRAAEGVSGEVGVEEAGGAEAPGDEVGRRAASRDVAIVGLAGRFPGAADLEAFWGVLARGEDALSWPPPGRWSDGSASCRAGFLAAVDRFDPLFFNLPPREAGLLDPQQRLALEVCVEALEDAGIPLGQVAQRPVGVFVGVTHRNFARERVFGRSPDGFSALGNTNALIANRLSFFLDAAGPSVVVDALCASSLVALHLACESLRRGECELAVVVGVHAFLTPAYVAELVALRASSPTGACKFLDDEADGFTPGEGVGVVVLRRLDRVETEGVPIRAVVRGTAVGHGGRAHGITVPSGRAQAAVIRAALADARTAAAELRYVEAHGTGTTLGDPIEVAGLREAFQGCRPGSCGIGSVKSNIGHLEPAAGVAGLCKVVLALERGALPPTLHLRRVNARAGLADSPFFAVDRLRAWPSGGGERVAGLSAFGMGGTNAHAVIAEAPVRPVASAPVWRRGLFVVSGRSPAACQRNAVRLADWLVGPGRSAALSDLGASLSAGRTAWEHRIAVVCGEREELARRLRAASPTAARAVRVVVTGSPRGLLGASELAPWFAAGAPPAARWVALLRALIVSELAFTGAEEAVAGAARACGCAVVEAPGDGEVELSLAAEDVADGWDELLRGLAAAYVAGAAIDLRPLGGRARLRTPSYAFADERYIAPLPGEERSEAAAGTGGRQATGRGWRFDARVGVASEHVLDGRPTLPLAVYVAVLRAADGEVQGLASLRVLRPLVVEDGAALTLTEEGGIWSVNDAAGPLARASRTEDRSPDWPVDLASARSRCGSGLSGDALYERLAAVGLIHGRSLRVIRSVRVGAEEAVAELASDVAPRWPDIDPAAAWVVVGVDAVLQACCALFPRGERRIPAAVAAISGACVGRPAELHVGRRPGEEEVFDAQIFDEDGRLWASLAGIELRRRPAPAVQATGPAPVVAPAGWFWRAGWTEEPAASELALTTRTWLVVAGAGGGLGAEIAAALRRQGATVVEARCGRATQRLDVGRWVLDPASVEDVARVWSACSGPAIGVVFATGADRVVPAEPEVLLMSLGRAVAGDPRLGPVVVVSAGAQTIDGAVAEPERAAILGVAQTWAVELSARVRCVDVEVGAPDGLASALAALRAAEEQPIGGPAVEVAVRGGRSRRRGLHPVTLTAFARRASPWVDDGCHVISGGLGAIGQAVMHHIAARCRRPRFALLSRRTATAAQQAAWAESGLQVMTCAVDVADQDAVAATLAAVQRELGRVQVVIHAAGLVEDRPLARIEPGAHRGVMAPKVAGLASLAAALAAQPPVRWIVCSSLASFVAGPGQASYAAASRALDAAAARLGATCVGWGAWAEIGMASDPRVVRAIRARGGRPMAPAAALAALDAVLERAIDAVCVGDFDPRLAGLTPEPIDGVGEFDPRPAGGSSQSSVERGAHASREVERVVVALQELLNASLGAPLDSLGRDVSLSRFGVDSLGSVELARAVSRRFGVPLTETSLFDYPTIERLAGHLVERGASAAGRASERSAGGAGLSAGTERGEAREGSGLSAGTERGEARGGAGLSAGTERGEAESDGEGRARGGRDAAIVGMAGRFAGAGDLADFAALLARGGDAIVSLPEERRRLASWPAEPAVFGGFLADIDGFDAELFRISPREASWMDPQQRLLLEVCWAALVDAGLGGARRAGARVGLFVGAFHGHYRELIRRRGLREDMFAGPGNSGAILANRLSFVLDARGPSLVVDTLCSSSLFALHQAGLSLRAGECDVAVVAAANVLLSPDYALGLARMQALAADGRCKAFDDRGDGFVSSEGVAAVVLRPLAAALSAGDRVRAVIRGSAVGHGGAASSLTAPSSRRQAEVIAGALRQGGLKAGDMDFIEAHGTGTALGDPLEVRGLMEALEGAGRASIGVGSVKTNIGHAEAAAGLAGVVKVVQALEDERMPGSLHFERAGRHLPALVESPLYVVDRGRAWRRGARVRRAGISAFGMGGANAHVVLEEAPAVLEGGSSRRSYEVLVLSGRSEEGLRAQCAAWSEWRVREEELGDGCLEAALGRGWLEERAAVVCGSGEELRAKLRGGVEGSGVGCGEGGAWEPGRWGCWWRGKGCSGWGWGVGCGRRRRGTGGWWSGWTERWCGRGGGRCWR